ncbi:unnamed protein product [Didymodactylos carnosus]|uniref:Uncharacterized protein n=2 Tax=Didymodactylos carnosus TaxID=1234261 RepID=A0A815DTD3_9BILA|nr:unnamed protein product [Didymodactylos carnosus]CAF4125255.1 unnamed protein product [Didymodactylos carnosus]
MEILLNDNSIADRNRFDTNYAIEYIETLANLITKLDEVHRTRLLSNLIGYYIFVCPECHSSITRRMISCTSHLNTAGLQEYGADLSDVNEQCRNPLIGIRRKLPE